MDLRPHLESRCIQIQQVDPAELSPGEFVHAVRQRVEQDHCKLIVIDSLNGYVNAMPEERFLMIQLHELLTYLGQKGVTTLLVVAQHGLVGNNMDSPVDLSYLADSVILTRYFESRGRVRKAISVVKKRSGPHEETIRELWLGEQGLQVGEPLEQLRGVLAGAPWPGDEISSQRRVGE
jgi:circadian clock protein KaiC